MDPDCQTARYHTQATRLGPERPTTEHLSPPRTIGLPRPGPRPRTAGPRLPDYQTQSTSPSPNYWAQATGSGRPWRTPGVGPAAP
eukprot:1608407-Pyramimonas_sp.AAC.1